MPLQASSLLSDTKGELKRGKAPLYKVIPPLFFKERGTKGVR
jgi:hypothetical protein